MARRPRLSNVGEEPNENEVLTEAGVPAEGEATGEVGGFAPGTLEQINADMGVTTETETDIPAVPAGVVTPESNGEDANGGDAGDNEPDVDDEKSRNKARRALNKEIKAIGEAYGAGKTSMIALAEAVTEAAANNTISPENAGEIYDLFRKNADAKATMDDIGLVPDEAIMEKAPAETTDKSRAQQVSKVGAFIKLGNKFDETAVGLIRRARNMHLSLLAGDRKTLKPGSTYTTLYAVATAQMKKENLKPPRPLTDEDLAAIMTQEPKAEAKPKTGADKIVEAIKAIRQAQNGNNAEGEARREPVESAHLDDALNSLRAALGEVDGGNDALADYDKEMADAEKKRLDRVEAKAAKIRAEQEARAKRDADAKPKADADAKAKADAAA